MNPYISIITPTNIDPNNKEMMSLFVDTIKSVKAQTVKNWEWIIGLNGPADTNKMAELLGDDERIKLVEVYDGTIGSLKKQCCSLVRSPITVELDHDDLLVPDCLEILLATFGEEPSVVFVYSNAAHYYYSHPEKKDYAPAMFNKVYGWNHRSFTWDGHEVPEVISFKPTPTSLSYIYYCPNHVRAWRSAAYVAVGGHNEELTILDDQDLIIRLYLYGQVIHIDRCLYLYRIHGQNSWIKQQKKIDEETVKIGLKYFHDMVTIHSIRHFQKRIDLGGRFSCPAKYEAVDIVDKSNSPFSPTVPYVFNMEDRWPFGTSTIGVVRAFDVLEHIHDKNHIISEIHRVLIPGGILMSKTPSTDGRGAFQDPTHVSYWNENSFWYYTRVAQAQYINNTEVRFQPIHLFTDYPSDWHAQHKISYTTFNAIALKNNSYREPGITEFGL